MSRFNDYKQQMEIDYYAYFAKAYFAFNYYLKDQCKKFENDRDRIDAIKEKTNVLKNFKGLLQENNIFLNNLLELREYLNYDEVKNEEKIISFSKVKLQAFQDKIICDEKHCGVRYFIKIQNNGKIVFSCGKSGSVTCQFEELEQKLEEKATSFYQRKRILNIINAELESYIADINPIIGKLKVKALDEEEYSKLFKAFVEIMYLLRNALFHSEINIENLATRLSYEKAYFLLRELIKVS